MMMVKLMATLEALLRVATPKKFQVPVMNLFQEVVEDVEDMQSLINTLQQATEDLDSEIHALREDNNFLREASNNRVLKGRDEANMHNEYLDQLQLLRGLIEGGHNKVMEAQATEAYIKQFIDKGERVRAIKVLRQMTGVSLRAAKDYVDDMFPMLGAHVKAKAAAGSGW